MFRYLDKEGVCSLVLRIGLNLLIIAGLVCLEVWIFSSYGIVAGIVSSVLLFFIFLAAHEAGREDLKGSSPVKEPEPSKSMETCSYCGGSGTTGDPYCSLSGCGGGSTDCSACGGTGMV